MYIYNLYIQYFDGGSCNTFFSAIFNGRLMQYLTPHICMHTLLLRDPPNGGALLFHSCYKNIDMGKLQIP